MAITLSDYLRFPFNGGRGIRTDQLNGAIVQSITEDGVATLVLADGSPETVTLSRDVVRESRDPDAADYAARLLFYDGIELRKVIRIPVPGHNRVVTFAENNLDISLLGTGIYADRNAASAANPFATRPTGRRYYNRSLARWELWQVGQYWDTRRSIAEPQSAEGSLWIGEWPTSVAASHHASRVGQITSYPDDAGEYILHRVATIVSGTEDGFRYELDPLFSLYALENPDIDNAESDVQGTLSGRTLARGVQEHERFTDVEQDILDDLGRITFPHPTDDWQVRQTYAVRDFFDDRAETFLSLGWDTNNRLRALSSAGRVARLGRHDQGRIYDGSERLRAGLISGDHWLFLRDNTVHGGSDIERAPVDGGDSAVEFEINSIRYFSMFADPDSGTLIGILRRINDTDMEVGLLAYDSVAGTVTAEDTITLTRAHIDAALGADYAPLTDIHRESAGGTYQDVAGAMLEGDTLYLLLTDIRKTDGHTTSVLVGFTLAGTPNNRTLTVLTENAVDELPISDELTSGILPLEADELFLARDTAAYRLSPHTEGSLSDKANKDLGNVDSDLTGAEQQAVREKLAAASQADLTLAGNAIEANAAAAAAAAATASSAGELATAAANSPARSDDNPENVGAAADPGTNAAVARRDHTHALPTDSTLEFDSVSGDLGVNVHDVITHLQQSIRYYTDSIDHPADPGGHSAGQMYRTGPFPTTISRVQSQIDVLVGHPSYAARIYQVDSDRNILEFLGESSHFVPLSNNPHSYDFTVDDDIGIPIPPSSFIVILFHAVGGVLIPLRTGAEASDSPGKSYQDANRDFNMVHSVVYEHVHPSVGDDTESHGDDDHIRGNIKIFYDIAYDHGSLLGGTKANTDLQNIDEDLTEAEQQAIRTRIGATGGGNLVVASSVTQPNSLIQGGTPRFRLNVNTPGNGEPLDGEILKFRFDGPFVNMVGSTTYSFATFSVSLFLNNTDLFSTDREGAFVYPDGRSVRGDDFPAGVDAYALKTPDGYVWLTSGDLLSGIESTVDADDVDDVDEVAVIRHTVGQDPTRRLPIAGLREVMTSRLNFANRNLDNITLADKDARDEHRVAIGVTPPFKDFPFGSGELLGDVFAGGTSNISGATAFRNSLYGIDSGFTPARLVRIDTGDPRNDNGPYGSIGDLPDGIDDPQSLVALGDRLYIINGNTTNAGLWRVNPDDPDDISGDFGRVGSFPAGLSNPRGAFPANEDIYIVQGNANPEADDLWRVNEFDPDSLANPLGLQYSLPSNITGAPTSGVFHDAYAYLVTGAGRQLFRVDPDNLSHGQFTTPDNRFGLVGELPIPDTETVTAMASLGGVLYVFTGGELWAKSVGNVELTRFKANADLQNISDGLTDDEKQVVRTRIGAADADHSHPGGGGEPAALAGNTAETLFDNRLLTETALSVLAGNVDWARTIDFGFTRALVEADDDKDLRIRFQITQGGQIRHFSELVPADIFRIMPEYTASSGSIMPTTGHILLRGADGRTARTATSLFSRLNIGVRQRTAAGEDALRVLLSSSGNVHVAATNIRGIIELVPRLENLTITGGNGNPQQQSGSGRILRTRSIVAADTLIAANNFNFDLSGDGQIALGRYALNPTPRSDIFDFVATIRVGGRGGIPIRLSREQFDYVGEYDLQDTWPFGGTGGGSWGNVTEIPCAMLYVNHRSEGVAKTQLKPQRQQIGWSMSDPEPATTILIFFSYNSSGNVDFVEMIVFTDQVVEIEGVHLHYWEDA